MKKLLLAGSDSVHTYNFLKLAEDSFSGIQLITNRINPEKQKVQTHIVNPSIANPFRILPLVRSIRKIIRTVNPDIIHVQQAGTLAFLILLANRRFHIPVVVTAWGSDILINPGKGRFYRFMVNYILRHAHAFTADAAIVAERMKQLAERDIDVTVTTFGIDIPPGGHEKENLIYSNRLHNKLYRIDKIIDAFSRFLSQTGEPWHLIIAGEGEETSALQKQANAAGLGDKIVFAGWLDKHKNHDYYSRARIFVSIPESDATSVSLLEAMASGCLPVVSDLPANHEWIKDGHNGLIVKDIDSDFLSRAVIMDMEMARKVNAELIQAKATKKAAQEQFNRIYNKLCQ